MKSEGSENRNWWSTVPGTITAIATFISAVGGLIVILNTNGCLKSEENIQVPVKTEPVVNYDSIATALATQWVEDIKTKNLDELVANSSVPYYADNSILTSLSELRAIFDTLTSSDKSFPALTDLRVYKASELKAKGIDFSHDKFFIHLNLDTDPYVALLGFKGEYVELVFRKTGRTLKIAGFWD
jgi:hypothetical protein